MDKISIDAIFSTKSDNRPLDINALFPKKTKSHNKFSFDTIIDNIEKKKKELHKGLKYVLNLCLSKIKESSSMDQTSLIFPVPELVYGNIYYRQNLGIEYLKKKLTEKYQMELFQQGNILIISWKNILEQRLNNKNQKK